MARPALSYPQIIAPGTIWERFPYLLPNLVCTVIVACGVVIGILFLEETHEEKKHRRDPGLEAGRWILSKLVKCTHSKTSCEKADLSETLSLLHDEQLPTYRTTEEQPPGYRTNAGSPNLPSTPLSEPQEALDLNSKYGDVSTRAKPTATKAFTRQVVLNIIGYGILA